MRYTVYVVGAMRGRTYQQSTSPSKVEKFIVDELLTIMSESAASQIIHYTICTDQAAVASGELRWFKERGSWIKDAQVKDTAKKIWELKQQQREVAHV